MAGGGDSQSQYLPKYVLQSRLLKAKEDLLERGEVRAARNIRTSGDRARLWAQCMLLGLIGEHEDIYYYAPSAAARMQQPPRASGLRRTKLALAEAVADLFRELRELRAAVRRRLSPLIHSHSHPFLILS